MVITEHHSFTTAAFYKLVGGRPGFGAPVKYLPVMMSQKSPLDLVIAVIPTLATSVDINELC